MPPWLPLAVFLGALTVSAYHRARSRIGGETIARRREGPAFLILRAVMGCMLFGPIVAHAVAPDRMAWATFRLPEVLRWAGFGVALLVIPTVHWVLRTLGRNVSETVLTKAQHQLVTGGPYRWVRHPLYATGLALFLALGLMTRSWVVLLATAVASVLIRILVIPREEAALLAKFGERYQAYRRGTSRLLPRVRRHAMENHGADTSFHLAQVNIARARGEMTDPVMAEFVARLSEINALADGSPGFVWRLQTEDGDATAVRPYEDGRILINLSVWADLAALKAYVYRSAHAAVMRRRREWFERFDRVYVALWWVPAGHRPSAAEAVDRLAHLERHGPTPLAFSFAEAFGPDGLPAPREGVAQDDACPAG